uniref:G-protein coupled receptors family 3 profile domain-containing protein n=1 Tax=Ornithorhynchus anatinus TaxID=9258 RepID=A0A6I8P4Q7_ORNAN
MLRALVPLLWAALGRGVPGAPLPQPGPAAGGEAAGPGSGEGAAAAAALAFLRWGDARRLSRATCRARFEVSGRGAAGPAPRGLWGAAGAVALAANVLNLLLQANELREASLPDDADWYQALVRGLAQGHPQARRAKLTFLRPPGARARGPRLVLRASREPGGALLLRGRPAGPAGSEGPHRPRGPAALRHRLLTNDLSGLASPRWARAHGYLGSAGRVRAGPPFLDCRAGRFVPRWLLTLSAPFHGLRPDLTPERRWMDVDLRDVKVDQCTPGPGWFAGTHRCDPESTQCTPLQTHGFALGRYVCLCRPGFYRVGPPLGVGTCVRPCCACQPCPEGCANCTDGTPCLAQEDRALRAALLTCQAGCMLAVFACMLLSYHYRCNKRVRASGLLWLEIILFGSLLLYFPVFILYFEPSVFRCVALRWVRLLGFATVYGTVALKLYRVLQASLSRQVRRGVPATGGRPLRSLALALLLVLWFLAAWTAGTLDQTARPAPRALVVTGRTPAGRLFRLCGLDRWDYMMSVAELLSLLCASALCRATWAVPSAYREPRYLAVALHNELATSAAFHLVRFLLVPSLHPDWTLLLCFVHTHGTVTVTLALLFVPKVSPGPPRIPWTEVIEEELDMRPPSSCLESSITSAWSDPGLDPGDIRAELKKLYWQLEVQQTRQMVARNPHLPERPASRRGPARSLLRRLSARRPPSLREAPAGEEEARPGRGDPRRHRSSQTLREDPGPARATPLAKSDGACHVAAAGDEAPPGPRPARSASGTGGVRSASSIRSVRSAPGIRSLPSVRIAPGARGAHSAPSLRPGAPASPLTRREPRPHSDGAQTRPHSAPLEAARLPGGPPPRSASLHGTRASDGPQGDGRGRMTPGPAPGGPVSAAPAAGTPIRAPASSRGPDPFAFICPWEGGTPGEVGAGPPAPPPAPRRALSVAATDPEGEGSPSTPPKSQSLKAPARGASLRSLGLMLKALGRSRTGCPGQGAGDGAAGAGGGGAATGGALGAPPPAPGGVPAETPGATRAQEEGDHPDEEGGPEPAGRDPAESSGAAGGPVFPLEGTRGSPGPSEVGATEGLRRPPSGGPDRLGSQAAAGPVPGKAEACPWEASGGRADICPWEEDEGSPGTIRAPTPDGGRRHRPRGAPSRGSPDEAGKEGQGQDPVRPWESSADSGGPRGPPPGKSRPPGGGPLLPPDADRWKAEVCPWEVSGGRADIRPWEESEGAAVPEAAAGQGPRWARPKGAAGADPPSPQQGGDAAAAGTPRRAGRLVRAREAICPRETVDAGDDGGPGSGPEGHPGQTWGTEGRPDPGGTGSRRPGPRPAGAARAESLPASEGRRPPPAGPQAASSLPGSEAGWARSPEPGPAAK